MNHICKNLRIPSILKVFTNKALIENNNEHTINSKYIETKRILVTFKFIG